MAIGGWTPTYTKEVTGNWYIDLTDAVVNKLLELKAYGWCEQASTPTPTTPVDIVCNNWTLKVRKESWLPFRYKKVEYITASWTQWLNTWIKLASTDIVEVEFRNSSSSWYWALYWVFAVWDSSAFYANWTYYWYDVVNNKVNTWVSVDTSRHSLRQDFGNWVITLDNVDTTYTPFTFDNNKDNYLFSRYYSNSYWYWFKGSCRKYKIYRWWELICDLIPVIDTQNNDEPWMYDLVSGDFRWNVGTWNFTAWANAQDDIEVYVDGTKEKIWISKEYYTTDWADVWYVINDSFEIVANSNYTVTAPIRFDAWTYDVSYSETSAWWRTFVIFPCDSEWNLVWDTPLFYKKRTTSWENTGTFTSNWVLARVSVRQSFTDITIKNETPIATATCEDLLWVWDYKDEQEILSGNVITKVGVMVLDGTEDRTTIDQYNRVSIVVSKMVAPANPRVIPAICTHFENLHNSESIWDITAWQFYTASPKRVYFHISQSTTAAWKQYLKDQLSAWTPVIVVYPLATPTTLSVAWQTLSIPAWDSRIEIVEWSILDLPLYAKYKSTTE